MNYAIFQCLRHDLCFEHEIKQGLMLKRRASRARRDKVLNDYLDAVSATVIQIKKREGTYLYD
jgi:hypothetical protein